jgi:hypothetical protein
MDAESSPLKGCFDGPCNRCQATKARYFSIRSHAYYCYVCAYYIDLSSITIDTVARPNEFDWPLTPDNYDRHKTKRELPYAQHHPDKNNDS